MDLSELCGAASPKHGGVDAALHIVCKCVEFKSHGLDVKHKTNCGLRWEGLDVGKKPSKDTPPKETGKKKAAKAGKSKALRTRVVTEQHPIEVGLSDNERATRGDELAQHVARLAAHRAEQKQSNKDYAANINSEKDQIERLAGEIRTGKRTETIACKAMYNFDNGTVVVRHRGKVVETRQMTEDERQESIPDAV